MGGADGVRIAQAAFEKRSRLRGASGGQFEARQADHRGSVVRADAEQFVELLRGFLGLAAFGKRFSKAKARSIRIGAREFHRPFQVVERGFCVAREQRQRPEIGPPWLAWIQARSRCVGVGGFVEEFVDVKNHRQFAPGQGVIRRLSNTIERAFDLLHDDGIKTGGGDAGHRAGLLRSERKVTRNQRRQDQSDDGDAKLLSQSRGAGRNSGNGFVVGLPGHSESI